MTNENGFIMVVGSINEQPRSEEEDNAEIKRQDHLGRDTFISFSDLQELMNNGEEFFIPPTKNNEGFLSCGDGHLYRGSIKDIYHQLQSELKIDPYNPQILVGLDRITKEILAFPDKVPGSKNEGAKEDPQVLSSQIGNKNF